MGWPFIDGNCINCAVSISSEDQLFSKFTVVDEVNSSLKRLEQEIPVLDAILYIYGFSATNLASAYWDEPRKENLLPWATISEASDYIIKNGLYLCTNCVSVFKQVYVATHLLKKLSKDEALLRTAIKNFSPTFIKIEVDSDESRCTAENSEIEHVIKSVNTISNSDIFSDTQFSTEADGSEAEDLFHKDDDTEEYDDKDIKQVAIVEIESLPSSSNIPLMNGAVSGPRKSDSKSPILDQSSDSRVVLSCDNVPRTKSTATSATPLKNDDKKSKLTVADLKAGSLPTCTVKLVRIEEEKDWKRMQLIQNMKITRAETVWKERKVATLMPEQPLQLRKEDSVAKKSDSQFCSENKDGKEKNDNIRDSYIKPRARKSRWCDERLKILNCSCGKGFDTLSNLRHHEKSHKLQEPVTCDTCGASFMKYSQLYIHKNKEHSELPGILFECSKCGKKCATRGDLRDHEGRHGKATGRLSPHREDPTKMIYCSCGKPYQSSSLQGQENTQESADPVMCDACGKRLRLRYSTTSDERRKILKCSCGKSFESLESLRSHEKSHKLQDPVICDTCGASFMKYSLLYIHKNKEHSELPGILYKCSKCGKKCATSADLRDHEGRHGKNTGRLSKDLAKLIYCDCGKLYRSLVSSQGDEKTQESTETVMCCDICGQEPRLRYSTTGDERRKILKCSCGKGYSSLETLRSHEKHHQIQEPVTCDTCGASFMKYSLLYIHKNKEHSELPGILFECKKCGKKRSSLSSLRLHERKHGKNTLGLSLEGEDPAKLIYCSCGKPYRKLVSLKGHEKTHKSLEPVICEVCGQKFPFSHQLYGHKILKHSEMPHLLSKCDFCDANFLFRSDRNVHVLQHHSNSRKFICEVCGKSFSCQKYLSVHSRVHRIKGPDKERVKCTECGITLKHTLSLRKHIKLMHRTEKKIMCHLCGKTTRTKSHMRMHMKIHDPNRTPKANAPKVPLKNSDLDLH